MVRTIKKAEKNKKKPGRPPKLILEDQVLVMLQYLREYRTYYHIAKDWNLSESAVCRMVHKLENILIKSCQFRLPGKKELWQTSPEEEVVVMELGQVKLKDQRKNKNSFIVENKKNIP
jgi:hypothetical protein